MDAPFSNTAPGKKPRVLIVEDEALIAITMEEYIRELGYDCIGPFLYIAAALPIARTERLDAAILDIKLGNVASYELAEILSARRIPFGFATGFLREGMDPRWSDRPYLTKPYQLEDVRQLLLTLLSPGTVS
jgi:CheY-like chemotaxis protein